MLEKWPETYTKVLLGANGMEAMQSLLAVGGRELVDYLEVGPFMGREAIEDLAAHSLIRRIFRDWKWRPLEGVRGYIPKRLAR